MSHLNIEIKAKCSSHTVIRKILKEKNARFEGKRQQRDVYFKVYEGRLKLRQDQNKYRLIHYIRDNLKGPKKSQITFYEPTHPESLAAILTQSLGVLCTVDKQREVWFIENVKIHLDYLDDLGEFVEIEAIDYEGTIGADKLYSQCEYYLSLFKISKDDLIAESYSDMILKQS